MYIAITGYTGYIGSVLCSFLTKLDYKILGIDSMLFANSRIPNASYPVVHKTLHKDIRDIDKDDLENVDVLVHLANLSNDPICDLDTELTFSINHKASVRLADIAKQCKIKKFIFASSVSVYGETGKIPVDENHPTNPLTAYSKAKLMVEQDLSNLASDSFNTISLRFSTAYGWSPCMRFDLVINNLVASAFAEKLLIVRDKPNLWRPFVHVEDIAMEIMASINLELPKGETNNIFNIGQNIDNYTLSYLITKICDLSPIKLNVTYQTNNLDKRSYWVNSNKMLKELPLFKPSYNVSSGVISLFEAYKKNQITANIYKSDEFKRINQILRLIKLNIIDKDLRYI